MLSEDFSPEQIAGRTGLASHEWIYRHIDADNGKQFADHRLIAACLQSDFYFADPYCARQRGSNETANGLTRQNRLRKILGFKTPLDRLLQGDHQQRCRSELNSL
ncbi:hypothetical protein BER93_08530 [Xanthomonas fragariae]|nr:hypothetical protein BER92_08505 [Xanthomonas fragariae]AOD18166.1 hypothetical protein BER93_08530 [Xanthomonas fragariae]ENZ96382.1 hypothetical protein O1K_05071 [Xanthomonas fragariae LMG 25863]